MLLLVPHGKRRHEPLNERKFLRPRGYSLTFQKNKALPCLSSGPENSESYACCGSHPLRQILGLRPFKVAAQDARNMILPPPSSSSKLTAPSEKPGQALQPWLLGWFKGVNTTCNNRGGLYQHLNPKPRSCGAHSLPLRLGCFP